MPTFPKDGAFCPAGALVDVVAKEEGFSAALMEYASHLRIL